MRQRLPDTPVVVVSASNNQTDIQMAFQHGAKGFITKFSTLKVLEQALELVLAGEFYVPVTALGAGAAHLLSLPAEANA